LGNFISGLVISASRPFEVGDRIHLFGGNITGYIEDITIRHTVVRTFMNSRIIVPNSVINKEMIENSNFLEEKAAGFLDAVITYGSDMDEAIRIMTEVIASHPDYIDPRSAEAAAKSSDPSVKVYVRALSLYGVELRASVWTGHIDTNFSTCSDLRISLKKAFDQAGIRFSEASVSSAPPESY
jgi:small-conductance mechanosensitive channel